MRLLAPSPTTVRRRGEVNENMATYETLKRAGHSPAKAAEIALDAKRGCKFALHWVKLAEGTKP